LCKFTGLKSRGLSAMRCSWNDDDGARSGFMRALGASHKAEAKWLGGIGARKARRRERRWIFGVQGSAND
jgi:hypothetical protein